MDDSIYLVLFAVLMLAGLTYALGKVVLGHFRQQGGDLPAERELVCLSENETGPIANS